MSGDYEGNNNNQNYLIGSKPESIRADIMHFKEEVLVDFRELSKKLEQKYIVINKELKENIETFNNKLSDFNLKLLDLSSRFVLDEDTREKLSELLIFKEKYESIMKTNDIKMKVYKDETIHKINNIEDILRTSLIFPGLIGPHCKYQKLPEFVRFVSDQIDSFNDFREQNLRDFRLYKTKIENMLNSMKLKIEVIQRELNINFSEKIFRCEDNFLREISLRDEKIKEIRTENYDYINKLDNNFKNLKKEVNVVKSMNEETNDKIKNTENKINENFINNLEKYNDIENKLFILKNHLQDSLIYLNRQGADLKLIKENETVSTDVINTLNKIYKTSDEKNEFQKNTEPDNNAKNNFLLDKGTGNFNAFTEENNIKVRLRNRIKSAYFRESDIARYVKGEITAEEIGISTNSRKKELLELLRKHLDEHLINKEEYNKKNLINKTFKVHVKEHNLDGKKEIDNGIINEELNSNNNSLEIRKELKSDRMMKTMNSYKNLKKFNFRDIDAKFHSFDLLTNFSKNSRNNNINGISNLKKEANIISNKKIINGSLFTKIKKPKIENEFKNKFILKNLNIVPNNLKMISLKNIDKELSSKNFFDKTKTIKNKNRLLSPIVRKNNDNKDIDFKENLIKKDNNNLKAPNLNLIKIKKNILDFNNDNNSGLDFNSNKTFNYERIENIK